MIGTIEYEELLEQALHKLYFEAEQEELLREPLEMKTRMDLHTGKAQKQWEDICHLVARQPLDSKPALALFHQSLRNAFLEGNRNVREMERRAESIGKEGMNAFLGNYLRGNESKVDELTRRMERLLQQQQQHKSEQKASIGVSSVRRIPVTGGLATVANDFMPASKTLPSTSNNHHKKPRREDSEEEEPTVIREGLSKDSSIQSSLGHYFQPNQQARKPKAFQPPQKTSSTSPTVSAKEEVSDERLTGIDPKLVEIITSEVFTLINAHVRS